MAHNVPAVYDVFAVAIKEREAFQQPQKCGGAKHHKGRSPTGVLCSPSRRQAAKHIQTCYMQYARTLLFLVIIPTLCTFHNPE
jgi:hypothetical protein